MRSYELAVLLEPSMSAQQYQELKDRIVWLLDTSDIMIDERWEQKLAHLLHGRRDRSTATIVCFAATIDPTRISDISYQFWFIKEIYRFAFFVRDNTPYVSKKDLLSNSEQMIEAYKEIIWKHKKMTLLTNKNADLIDRKNTGLLRIFMTRFWDIKPRKYTWISVKLQKKMREQIIRSRGLWIVEFTK